MSLRFAISPIAWINDDLPSLGAGTTVEQILAEARAIGFAGIEIGGTFPRAPADLARLLAPYSLALAGGWYGGRLLERSLAAEIEAAAPRVALLQALACKVFIYAEATGAIQGAAAPLADRPRLDPAQRRRLFAGLDGLADHLGKVGLALAYHFHLGTVIEDADDLEALLAGTSAAVGLVLDTGHAALAGIDPIRVIAEHPRRIVHVHAKDVRRQVFERVRARRMSFLAGVVEGMFTVPGDGDLDWDPILGALHGADYDSWIVLEAEQDPAKAPPARYAALGLSTLRAAAARAGFEESRS